jgi:hypothetical protein
MLRHYHSIYSVLIGVALVSLLLLLWNFRWTVQTAQAGGGPTVEIPQSNIVPLMDGVCNLSEYSDAVQITITVGTDLTFPVFMKHSANDAYFCFGDASGLPLPNGASSQVTIYIDPNNDGLYGSLDDFGIWMPYDPQSSPWARHWGTDNYNGTDPGGWQAVKYQTPEPNPFWQVEFRISRQTMGGWKHTVGMAPFYHWWRYLGDDYSWPAPGIWSLPWEWGNGHLVTGNTNIGLSATVPVVDGQCDPAYSDASTILFDGSGRPISAYVEHSPTDLYICLHDLTIPAAGQRDGPNAAIYIDRTGFGGGTPSSNDLLFTISYSGTIQANSGDGIGYTGPDPGGYVVALSQYSGGWDAEFQISSTTIGYWWARKIGLTVAEQGVNSPGDDYGWPIGYSPLVSNSWGEANLIDVGAPPIFLPLIVRGP